MSTEVKLADGVQLALDEQGFLEDWQDWTPAVAEAFAAADGVVLTETHRAVLNVLREYYAEFEIAPPMRALVPLLRQRLHDENLGSRELYRLFPGGPAKQACRYAGLPRPVSCI